MIAQTDGQMDNVILIYPSNFVCMGYKNLNPLLPYQFTLANVFFLRYYEIFIYRYYILYIYMINFPDPKRL